MRVVYIHQFYPGETSPGPEQPRFLVRRLAERGHEVHVLACDFNAYNEQDELPEHWKHESGGSVRVDRLRAPRNLRASLRNRLMTYLRFAITAYRHGRKLQRPDVIIATIQPLFSGYAAYRLSKKWRKPFLMELRDLWPDALVVKGAVSRFQASPLESLARRLYHKADRLVSLTPGIKLELLKKGVAANKLDLFPNGYRASAFAGSDQRRSEVRCEFQWDNKFVAVFAGTHTEVTAVEVMVKAAQLLQDRSDIELNLFGSGQTKKAAIELAKQMQLINIRFHDPVPKSRIPSILSGADVALMTLFQSPLIHIYFENKLIDYLGAGKPILGAMDGLQSTLIQREGAGRVVPSLDHKGLANLIRWAADQPDELSTWGQRGHQFVRNNLDQGVILDRYCEVLERLAAGDAAELPAWDPLNLV